MNTEPIAVSSALKLCEMAIEECDKATPGDLEAAPRWVLLSRAVMRPMLEGIRSPLARLNPTWVCGHTSDMYPILSVLRDHYDKTRPEWSVSK